MSTPPKNASAATAEPGKRKSQGQVAADEATAKRPKAAESTKVAEVGEDRFPLHIQKLDSSTNTVQVIGFDCRVWQESFTLKCTGTAWDDNR